MLYDSTSTLINGLVSSSSKSNPFPPQSSSKWIKRQARSRCRRSAVPLQKKKNPRIFKIHQLDRSQHGWGSCPTQNMWLPLLRPSGEFVVRTRRKRTNTPLRPLKRQKTSPPPRKKSHTTINKCDPWNEAEIQYRSRKGGRIHRASVGNSDAPVSACDTPASTSNCTRTQEKAR